MMIKCFSTGKLALAAYGIALGCVFAIAPIVDAASNTSPAFKVAQDASGKQDAPTSTKPKVGEVDIPDPKSTNDAVEESFSSEKDEEGTKDTDEAKNESSEDEPAQENGLLKNTNKPEAPPIVYSNLDKLPFPARKMHELILNAARSGDIEKLRPFIGYGDDVTMLSLGGFDDDPIEFLKSISGDTDGHELLAIITEILESDFVLIDEGTEREVYVWPYFYAYPLEKLTPKQRVQLFRLMTYGDYQEMESFGAYIFYRLGITPQGRWRFFVAGD